MCQPDSPEADTDCKKTGTGGHPALLDHDVRLAIATRDRQASPRRSGAAGLRERRAPPCCPRTYAMAMPSLRSRSPTIRPKRTGSSMRPGTSTRTATASARCRAEGKRSTSDSCSGPRTTESSHVGRVHLRMARGHRHQHEDRRRHRRQAHRHLPGERLRPVHLGMGRRARPGFPAVHVHDRGVRVLERHVLRQPRVRRSSTNSNRRRRSSEERAAIVAEMQQIIYEDIPEIVLYNYNTLEAYDSAEWGGLEENVAPNPDGFLWGAVRAAHRSHPGSSGADRRGRYGNAGRGHGHLGRSLARGPRWHRRGDRGDRRVGEAGPFGGGSRVDARGEARRQEQGGDTAVPPGQDPPGAPHPVLHPDFNFFLFRVIPGDPVDAAHEDRRASSSARSSNSSSRSDLGLLEPLPHAVLRLSRRHVPR